MKIPIISNTLLNLVYPNQCLCCDSTLADQEGAFPGKGLFCVVCWSKVKRLEGAACPRCAEPFPSQVSLKNSPGHLCSDCRLDLPAFSGAITPYHYEETLSKGVRLLKYQQQTRLVKCFVDLLLDDLRPILFDRVIAIPLHIRRLRSREFNQSLLLAKGIAEYFNRPLLIGTMLRTKETAPQVGLSRKDRKRNVHHAFQIAKPDAIIGQRLLLIDDVYTTGATLREGSKTLIKAGTKNVFVTAPCRMVLH